MNLRSEVSRILIERGFNKKGRVHKIQLDDDWSFIVDTGPLGKRTDIAPVVAIRHDGLEILLRELMEVPKDDWGATIGANVGYILDGEYRHWDELASSDIVINDIYAGFNKLKPFMSLDKLEHAWEIYGKFDPALRYRKIVSLFFIGEKEEIINELDNAYKYFCKYDDEICEQFKVFYENSKTKLMA